MPPQIRGGAFAYRKGVLHCEDVNLTELEDVLDQGKDDEQPLTPFFVYSKKQLLDNIRSYKSAFARMNHRIAFSLKSNYNPVILDIIRSQDMSLVTVSGNEMLLALKSGFKGDKIFFNGNGKQLWEIKLAITNTITINVDSCFDAETICKLADQMGKVVQVLIRLSPSISMSVKPQVTTGVTNYKFGVRDSDLETVLAIIKKSPRVIVVGIHVHLGTAIQDVSIYTAVHEFIKKTLARNHEDLMHVKIINVGGGLDIDYTHKNKNCPKPADLARAIPGEPEFQIMIEPGRSLLASAGLMMTRVLGHKKTPTDETLVVVDGTLTDHVRPAHYTAHHLVVPVVCGDHDPGLVSIVGPVCESGDFLAKGVELGGSGEPGDLLALLDTGAYGAVMSSNYNMRPRPAEVLIDGKDITLIAKRQTFDDIYSCFNVEVEEEVVEEEQLLNGEEEESVSEEEKVEEKEENIPEVSSL